MDAKWFHTIRPVAGRVVRRCYCFPYAGTSIAAFFPLAKAVPPDIEIRVASLPGRGLRIDEPHEDDFSRLALALADALDREPDGEYVVAGHSMGALLGFEVVRELRRRGRRLPAGLIISGARAPQRFAREKVSALHDLPRDAFLDHLRRLQGTPDEILNRPDLMDFVLPVLRADFKVCSTYAYTEEPPFDFPLSVLGGRDDVETTREEMEAWSLHTTAEFFFRMFDGGHFFINDQWPLIGSLVRRTLDSAAARSPYLAGRRAAGV